VGAVIHGCAGRSVMEPSNWVGSGTPEARRGAFFERVVAGALHHWLAGRLDEVHVFHDLVGLNDISGARLGPVSLGGTNIDHLILTGRRWLMIDAKGCGAGSLRVHAGKGVLVRGDGTHASQPWMDDRTAYSRAGIPFRLTEGKAGLAVWVVPQATAYSDPSVVQARFLTRCGQCTVLNDAEVRAGELDALLPPPADSADPRDVERLLAYVSAPDVEYRLDPRATHGAAAEVVPSGAVSC
jgi:hypothetical protein